MWVKDQALFLCVELIRSLGCPVVAGDPGTQGPSAPLSEVPPSLPVKNLGFQEKAGDGVQPRVLNLSVFTCVHAVSISS